MAVSVNRGRGDNWFVLVCGLPIRSGYVAWDFGEGLKYA